MATTTRVRLADFLLNPDIDESRLELIDGEVTAKPMPTWGHTRTAAMLIRILDEFGASGPEPRAVIEAANASPLPDVAFYRDGEPDYSDYMRTPPHVAIEILSAGQTLAYMRRKAALYFSFGVESVWIVDVDRKSVHVLEGGEERVLVPGQRLTSPSVPGLDVDVDELFPRRR